MQLIKQRHNKDCFQAVLSSITGIDYEEIPEFYKLFPEENDMPAESESSADKFREEFDSWLDSKGLYRIMFDAEYSEKHGNVKVPYCSLKEYFCVGILRKEYRPYDHAVVLKVTKTDIQIYDPKPNSDYDLRDIIGIEIIIKERKIHD